LYGSSCTEAAQDKQARESADKELRGATMGLHSMCGYAGGFIGPLGVGLVLDWAGNADGWGLAFGHLALITCTVPAVKPELSK